MPFTDSFASWTCIRAERDGGKTALVGGNERVSYAELERRSAKVAGALAVQGVAKGDRVVAVLKNRCEFLELLFGTARLGAVFVPLNFRLSGDELTLLLRDCEPRVVVAQAAVEAAVREGLAGSGSGVPLLLVDGAGAAYAAWRDSGGERPPVPVAPGDPALIQYTSGSTGSPKGAVITHENVLWNVFNYVTDWDLVSTDTTLVLNPIFHAVLHILTMPLLYKGGTVVLMEDFAAAQAIDLLERERVTVLFGIPTSLALIADEPSFPTADLAALRFVDSGGSACPLPLIARYTARGIPYRQGYGLTETTSSSTQLEPEEDTRKRGSIGRPFFHMEAKVVRDDGGAADPDEPGELQLRGRNICDGYWRNPEATARAFTEDGWFRTGDVARQDADGFLFIVDRKKDIIISGGENIASIEVEQTILAHPAVREAAVIGVPHARWGESPRAIVAAGGPVSAEEIIAHCRGRIAHYKCPTSVVFVDELPKMTNGKISKIELRRLYGEGSLPVDPGPRQRQEGK